MTTKTTVIVLLVLVLVIGFFVVRGRGQFQLPEGETTLLEETDSEEDDKRDEPFTNSIELANGSSQKSMSDETKIKSNREIFVTDGVKHSIPLDEILRGGPPCSAI